MGIRDTVDDIFYGISNLCYWLPTIWRDRDWDHIYLSRILERKLSSMARCHEIYGHHVDHKEVARDLRICAEVFRRLGYGDGDTDIYQNRQEYFKCRPQGKTARAICNADNLHIVLKIMSRKYLGWWD